ncbi:MAG: hypothetical protein V7L21_06390 [Nostoc sp.]|uniref:hypothetical protein n=1 Tax=Nostoc sp. TaxID=1180 RepID=UPI002FF518B1
MNPLQRRRKRGVILTPQGFEKLQTAKCQAQSWENLDKRYTLEDLSDRTGLDPDTLMKVFHCQVGVDKQTLNTCFRAFNLLLEPSDYQLPRTSDLHQLIESYAGNPLALNIAFNKIDKLFDGNISEFLNQKTLVFGEISQLLKEHFKHVSDTENLIIGWLAGNSQPASLSELRSQISPTIPTPQLLDALESLQERSLVEKNAYLFSVSPMIREYINHQLIQKQISSNIKQQQRPSQKHRSITTREKSKLSFNIPALPVVKQQG